MTRPRGRLGALVLAALALGACRAPERVFVCPVGGPGWGERAMAVAVLEVEDGPGGLQITGRVTDAETGDALIAASAAVVGTGRGAATDLEGRLVLGALGLEDAVRFSYAGYVPFTLTVRELAGLEGAPPG